MIWLIAVAFVFALLPCAMIIKNLKLFRALSGPRQAECAVGSPASWTVVIPARNEEASIAACIDCLLRSRQVELEVLVVDDHSTDSTPMIVEQFARTDHRVRRIPSAPLPDGWNGKQFACWQGANQACHERILFVDADVRMSDDALLRCTHGLEISNASLVSGFPFQETFSWSEQLMIPMMHLILLGYLPLDRMRSSTNPAFAAGCGQLFMTKKAVYFQVGGHQQIRNSRHDGIQLPRLYRRKGLMTDLFDATDVATCRMYRNAGEVSRGLRKNAVEGIANSRLIGIFTILLGGAFLLPVILLAIVLGQGQPMMIASASAVVVLSYIPRWLCAIRFRQSWLGVLFHPIAVAWFLLLQWWAYLDAWLGRSVAWRGRK